MPDGRIFNGLVSSEGCVYKEDIFYFDIFDPKQIKDGMSFLGELQSLFSYLSSVGFILMTEVYRLKLHKFELRH
jgi:hypothetical protein